MLRCHAAACFPAGNCCFMEELANVPNKEQTEPSHVQPVHPSSPLLSSVCVCVLFGVCFAVAAETTPGGRARLPAGGQMGVI